jgi:Flp pilus assembly protein TadD
VTLELGDFARAQSASERLIALASDDASGYTLRGMVAAEKGEYDEAVRWHRLACERAPKDAPAKVALGMSLWYSGRKDEGKAMLQAALTADPGSALAREAIAAVDADTGSN